MKYFYNQKTGTLHYYGYCRFSQEKIDYPKYFDTENEAYQDAGKHLKVCKNCEKNREKKKQSFCRKEKC